MLPHSCAFNIEKRISRDLIAWLVCLSAGLFFFYEFFQLNLFDVINQSLRDSFHIDAQQLSWMSSTYLWGNILFLLPAGFILDRFSTRAVILAAMGLCVIGTLGFAASTTFSWAAFFHSLSGIGNAFCFLSCVILVSRWFPPRRRAFVIGCVVTLAFLGGMMAHTPLAYLNAQFGWRYALLIDGMVGVVLFIWIMLVVRNKPEEDSLTIKTSVPAAKHLRSVLLNPQNLLAGLYTACLNLPVMVICALWGASYLQVVHGLSQMAASNVVSLIYMGSIVGCPMVGWLSDALGRRKTLMIIGAIFCGLLTLPLLIATMLPKSVLGFIFFALGFFSSTQVITYPLIAESNPEENTGIATGIASTIIMGGAGVGQVLFGWLMQQHAGLGTQQYALHDFQFAMAMFPVASIVALIAISFARETYCGRRN